jgi:hypothetical protein
VTKKTTRRRLSDRDHARLKRAERIWARVVARDKLRRYHGEEIAVGTCYATALER